MCPRCRRPISANDTIAFDGDHICHVDCQRPHDLSHEERALLFKYCFGHAVAECPTCGQRFRQQELGSDPLGSRALACPDCQTDLTEVIRAHLVVCAELPEQLRRRVQLARETAQRLLKRAQELSNRADVLMREAEAAQHELDETRERARRERERRARCEP